MDSILPSLPPPSFSLFFFPYSTSKGGKEESFYLSLSLSLSLSLATIESRQYRGGEGETSIKAEKVEEEEEKEDIEKRRRRRRKTVASEQRERGKQFSASPQSHPVFRKLRLVSSPPPPLFLSSQRCRRAQDLTIPKTFLLKREPQQPPSLRNLLLKFSREHC